MTRLHDLPPSEPTLVEPGRHPTWRPLGGSSAGTLVHLSVTGTERQGPSDRQLFHALLTVSDALRRAEPRALEAAVDVALGVIDRARVARRAGDDARVLELVLRELATAGALASPEGVPPKQYCAVQLRYVELLLERHLLVPALMAMREYVGSLGVLLLCGGHADRLGSGDQGGGARPYAATFLAMVESRDGRPSGVGFPQRATRLGRVYRALDERGSIEELRRCLAEISDLREGLESGWTGEALVEGRGRAETLGWKGAGMLRRITLRALDLEIPPAPLAKPDRPRRLLVLTGYEPTTAQRRDATSRFLIEDASAWISPPFELREAWIAVDPVKRGISKALVTKLRAWLAEQGRPGDLLWVEGDNAAVFTAVTEARRLGLKPIYATRRAKASQPRRDGDAQPVAWFEHVRFRAYPS